MKYAVTNTKRWQEKVTLYPTYTGGDFQHYDRWTGETLSTDRITLEGMKRRHVKGLDRAINRGDMQTADRIMSLYVKTNPDYPGYLGFGDKPYCHAFISDPGVDPEMRQGTGTRLVRERISAFDGQVVNSEVVYPFQEDQVLELQAVPLQVPSE